MSTIIDQKKLNPHFGVNRQCNVYLGATLDVEANTTNVSIKCLRLLENDPLHASELASMRFPLSDEGSQARASRWRGPRMRPPRTREIKTEIRCPESPWA